MNFRGEEWRARRNLLNQTVAFSPIHYSLANYSTDTNTERKSEMKSTVVQEDLFTRLHSIPDPLRKNLADTLIIGEDSKDKKVKMPSVEQFHYENDMDNKINPPEEENSHGTDSYPSLAGITGFFTSFFGAISGAMFHKRPKSPVSQYYDCFDSNTDMSHEGSPSFSWHSPNYPDQNKNERAHIQFCTVQPNDSMNNCRTAVAQCEGKLNTVRNLLTNKTAPGTPKFRPRRPRRVFVEPGSIEEQFEDVFVPEDLVTLADDDYIEYINIPKSFKEEFCEVDAPNLQTCFKTVQEITDIVENVDNVKENNRNESQIKKMESDKVITDSIQKKVESKMQEKNIPNEISTTSLSNTDNSEVTSTNQEVISSCEDKIAKLKLMLQEKRKKSSTNENLTDSLPELVMEESVVEAHKKPSKTIPIEKKHDKRFKNPNRLHTNKRRKTRMKKTIQDDMKFAHEIDSEDISSSADNSPRISVTTSKSEPILEMKNKDYFDELKGRFHSSSTTESEDSFQIVFSDSPKLSRLRRPSDCDSEDSFIVFEDSPDSCYTSNDVFGEELDHTDEEYTDSESDVSDSGCVSEICKLSHSFSKSVGDLTDPSLYDGVKDSMDDVDSAIRTVGDVLPLENVSDSVVIDDVETTAEKTGLLIDEAKKLQRKGQPAKKVSFSDKPPKVHVMRVWAFAARQARAGHWERHALDRERFKRRIADVDVAVSWVLKPQHRSRVMFQRFMPWWNAQRRKEIAERKQREEEERIKREEEEQRRKLEEEERLKKEEEERVQREAEAILKAEADRIEYEKREEKNRQKNCKVTKYVYKNGKYSRVCPNEKQINNRIDADEGNDEVAQNNDSQSDNNKIDKITDVNLIDINNKVENIAGIV